MRDKMLSLKKREKEKKKKDLYRLIVFSEWYQSLGTVQRTSPALGS